VTFDDTDASRNPRRFAGTFQIKAVALAAGVAWTLVVCGSLYWNQSRLSSEARALAQASARTHHERDLAVRVWVASHGGVYVPVSETTPANPHLDHIEGRDIPGPEGRPYTLMNPAYVMRQLNENPREHEASTAYLTSLNPLRPANSPDSWERTALLRLEQGEAEFSEFTEEAGDPILRMMMPMVTLQGCLKCHGHQGYEVGDLRGGNSITVPMAPLIAAAEENLVFIAGWHFLFWLLGIVGITYGRKVSLRSMAVIQKGKNRLAKHGQKLHETNVELARRNRELDEFNFMTNHDLQEPLRKLVSFSELLRRDLGDELPANAEQSIGFIQGSAMRMKALIGDLDELSSADRAAMEIERLPLAACVDAALGSLASEIEECEALIERDALPEVQADLTLLTKLFRSLIHNALKFAPQGRPRIRITAELTGGEWILGVRDNGIGIEPKYVEQIFSPFKRLHSTTEYDGTGIGLAICRKVLERHGGRIWVESTLGEGAHFRFVLGRQAADLRVPPADIESGGDTRPAREPQHLS
jgi:signal transduction histidine kinase